MAIPHQQAADNEILDIRSRWDEEDANAIVQSAEEVAEQSGSPELTRVHLHAAEANYKNVTGKQPNR